MSIHSNRIEITQYFDGDHTVEIVVNNEKFRSLGRLHKEPQKIMAAKKHAKRLQKSLRFPVYLCVYGSGKAPGLIAK